MECATPARLGPEDSLSGERSLALSSDQHQYPGLPPLEGQRPATSARPWPPSPSTFGSPPANAHSYSDSDAANAYPDYSASSVSAASQAGATWARLPAVQAAQAAEAGRGSLDDEADPWDSDATIYEACKTEHARVMKSLNELRVVEQQTAKELERLNHLKVLEGAKVRELEEHLETHSRQDIRTVYLAASEAEMRAFMMSEQRDHLREKLRLYTRYEKMLSRLMEAVRSLPDSAPASPASRWGASAISPAPSWNASAVMPAPQVPGGTLAGLPAIGPAAQPGWPSGPALSTGAYPAARPAGPFGHGDTSALARIIQAQESVRQRMAQRLHDGPTQSLANVVLTAEICERLAHSDLAKAMAELAKLKVIVNGALQETRKLIFELRPMTLDDLGLMQTLRRYAAELSSTQSAQISVNAQGERRLPNTSEVSLFRVAQEAVVNAIEHGHATVILVNVMMRQEKIVLLIEDNGQGFDVEPALKRTLAGETMGIASMQERAELLGGWLKIESTRGRGTRVELSILS